MEASAGTELSMLSIHSSTLELAETVTINNRKKECRTESTDYKMGLKKLLPFPKGKYHK